MRRLLLLLLFLPVPAIAAPCDRRAAEEAVAAARQAPDAAEVLRQAQAAVAHCDGLAPAHNALGTAREATGDLGGARQSYERARELEPGWYLPYVGLGDLARRRGAPDEARAAYSRALGIVANDRERDHVLGALAVVQKERGDFAFKTADDISRGLRLDGPAVASRQWGEAVAVGNEFYESNAGLSANLSILFRVGSAELLPEGLVQLEEVRRALAGKWGVVTGKLAPFLVEGHASSEGDPARNLLLSTQRAEAVAAWLRRRLGGGALFDTVGRGSRVPVHEGGVENREKSRRVTLVRRFDEAAAK